MTLVQHSDYVSIYPVDPMPAEIAALRSGAAPVWLFAYGSLMWNPGFAAAERLPARLYGYHRRFCLYSRDYRGTPERPGLVLGLDRGGSCHGIAYLLPPERTAEVLDRIWAREMTGMVYRMRRLTVRTPDGPVAAYACVVRRDSPDYAGRLSPDEAARLLAHAKGGRGSGRDYLAQTLHHLETVGIADRGLRRVAARIARLDAGVSDIAPIDPFFTARGR
ncbi:MAG TPA: gamma-glutamylcyclotransferase [Stellaceae bacterium]|nr:gamma-glutamylcyclotransferase [Stellaceae bacterium]